MERYLWLENCNLHTHIVVRSNQPELNNQIYLHRDTEKERNRNKTRSTCGGTYTIFNCNFVRNSIEFHSCFFWLRDLTFVFISHFLQFVCAAVHRTKDRLHTRARSHCCLLALKVENDFVLSSLDFRFFFFIFFSSSFWLFLPSESLENLP